MNKKDQDNLAKLYIEGRKSYWNDGEGGSDDKGESIALIDAMIRSLAKIKTTNPDQEKIVRELAFKMEELAAMI